MQHTLLFAVISTAYCWCAVVHIVQSNVTNWCNKLCWYHMYIYALHNLHTGNKLYRIYVHNIVATNMQNMHYTLPSAAGLFSHTASGPTIPYCDTVSPETTLLHIVHNTLSILCTNSVTTHQIQSRTVSPETALLPLYRTHTQFILFGRKVHFTLYPSVAPWTTLVYVVHNTHSLVFWLLLDYILYTLHHLCTQAPTLSFLHQWTL